MVSPRSPLLTTPSGKPRARSFGIPFDGEPGPNNAITDVAGVTVGYTTLISGDGPLVVGKGPVRTGVTAILPRPRDQLADPVFAGMFSQNGDGELTGLAPDRRVRRVQLPGHHHQHAQLRRDPRRHAALDAEVPSGLAGQRLGIAGGGRDL